jgi:hypothetical protein
MEVNYYHKQKIQVFWKPETTLNNFHDEEIDEYISETVHSFPQENTPK